MSVQSTCAHSGQTTSFHNGSYGYCESDVTTVYDAVMGCDAAELANTLLLPEFSSRAMRDARQNHIRLLRDRITLLKRFAFKLGPNCECAPDSVLLPWNPQHLSSLSGVSWPDVLGRRIALPSSLSMRERHKLLADVLLHMSHL